MPAIAKEKARVYVDVKRKVLEGKGNYAYATWVNSGQNHRLHKIERLLAGQNDVSLETHNTTSGVEERGRTEVEHKSVV